MAQNVPLPLFELEVEDLLTDPDIPRMELLLASRSFLASLRDAKSGSKAGATTTTEYLRLRLALELIDDVKLLSKVYGWALDEAGVEPIYSTEIDDPSIVISPTVVEQGTPYNVASESSMPRLVSFYDNRSGRDVTLDLQPGRATVLLVSTDGEIPALYEPRGVGTRD